jgi:hypothetical protein
MALFRKYVFFSEVSYRGIQDGRSAIFHCRLGRCMFFACGQPWGAVHPGVITSAARAVGEANERSGGMRNRKCGIVNAE